MSPKQQAIELLETLEEPIEAARKACAARAFDQIRNSAPQKHWQEIADDLDECANKIDAALGFLADLP